MSTQGDLIAEAWRQASPKAIHPELDETGRPVSTVGADEAIAELATAVDRYLELSPTELTVLDYGAGTGRLALELARYYGRVILADTNPTYLELADTILRAAGRQNFDTLLVAPVPDEVPTVDLIVSLNVFLHLDLTTAGRLLNRFAAALPDDGLLALQLPLYETHKRPATWTSVGTWTPAMLELAAAAAGLEVLEVFTNPGAYTTRPGPNHRRLHLLRPA